MPAAKHNWDALKAEFMTSKTWNLQEFLNEKNVPYNGARLGGWVRDKKAHQKRILDSSLNRSVAIETESLSDARMRQARTSRYLQLKGMERLKELTQKDIDAEQARKMVVSGLQEERRALGLEGGGSQNLTQININQGPKTNLDMEIEAASVEELIEIVAELKRIKRERIGQPAEQTAGADTTEVEEGELL